MAAYPALRGAALGWYYLAFELGALGSIAWAFVGWVRRGEHRCYRVSPAVACLSILGASEAASVLAGPWLRGVFGEAWGLQHAVQIVTFAALALVQWSALADLGE